MYDIGRIYTVDIVSTASAAAIDWAELKSGTTMAIALVGIDLGQSTELGDAAEEQIQWFVKRASGSYTSGSGGSTPTPSKQTSTDAAATFTAETVNTTQAAVGTGAYTTLHSSTFNLRSGLLWFPPPRIALTAGISEALVFGLAAAPADSVTWKGTLYVAELF